MKEYPLFLSVGSIVLVAISWTLDTRALLQFILLFAAAGVVTGTVQIKGHKGNKKANIAAIILGLVLIISYVALILWVGWAFRAGLIFNLI